MGDRYAMGAAIMDPRSAGPPGRRAAGPPGRRIALPPNTVG